MFCMQIRSLEFYVFIFLVAIQMGKLEINILRYRSHVQGKKKKMKEIWYSAPKISRLSIWKAVIEVIRMPADGGCFLAMV